MTTSIFFFMVFLIVAPTKIFAECIPAQCNKEAAPGCDWETEYCVAYCCVLKPTPAGSSPTPGGSYEYQGCPEGQVLSCGTVAEAGSPPRQPSLPETGLAQINFLLYS